MGYGYLLASLNVDGGFHKTHQQLLDLDPLDFTEPTSVLDLTSCISPPLQADVWAEQKEQFLVEELYAQTQQAWEELRLQQHLFHREHQQQRQLLCCNWEHQEQIHAEDGSVVASMGEHVAMEWEVEDQQLESFDSWVFPTEYDLSLEDLSSSTLPHLAVDDDFLNLDSWIYGSDGSSITIGHESSTALLDLEGSFISSSCVNSCTDAASSDENSPLSMHEFARAVLQNFGSPEDCDRETRVFQSNNADTALSGLQGPPCSLLLSSVQQGSMAEENRLDVCRYAGASRKANLPFGAPNHQWLQSSSKDDPNCHDLSSRVVDPGLQTSEASSSRSPPRSNETYFQTRGTADYQERLGPTTRQCVSDAAPAHAATKIHVKARTNCKLSTSNLVGYLDSTSTSWHSFVSADFPALGDASPTSSGAGFHGGMITQLDIAQGVGRMEVETRNVRARMDADAALAGTDSVREAPEKARKISKSCETQNVNGSGGVQMVHLLLACAEAVACRDSRQAALLLQQLQRMTSPYGDSMQRVTSCFVEGLVARLAMMGSQPLKSSSVTLARRPPNEMEKDEGFRLMYRACPYVAFGHFAANCAILDAFQAQDALHIVDLGMTHALQWSDLISRLAARNCGPPKLLRITAFGLATGMMMDAAGREIADCAKLYNIPFEFRVVRESLENLQPSMLELREGEALAVNSMLQLHCVVKESRGSLNSVLQSVHQLSPKILTLVEQNASHNGPFFLGRFIEALHYYSAIFDSIDANLPRDSNQRVIMEQFYFAEEIKNIVSCEGPARIERHERIDQWRRRMSRAGFQPLSLKFFTEARSWLSQYDCGGYTLAEEKGCLVLGWKGKPLVAASSWRC